jgi:glycosyltransferase involved in cell wall biosynthesis
MAERKRILLGVTVDMSLSFMAGLPAYLVTRGWEVHVVSSPGPLLSALEKQDGVVTHPIEMARNPSFVGDLKSLLEWLGVVREVRPHLVSVGTPKAGLLGILAARILRVPRRVYHLRGLRLETSKGVGRLLLKSAEKFVVSGSHRVLSVSYSLQDRALELGVASAEKLTVLGYGSSNGVDLKAFDRSNFSEAELEALRASTGLDPSAPVVGFVGRLTEDKGLKVLAEARALLHKRGIDHQLLVVGGIDGRGGDTFVSTVMTTGRPAFVTGRVMDPAIYYQLMDVLCLPTLREGFPNVVLEAAAAGIPAVTTDATGAIDSVVNGETGFIAHMDSAQEIADLLEKLLSSESLRTSLGEKAKARATEFYSRESVWELTEEFYSRELELAGRYSARVRQVVAHGM